MQNWNPQANAIFLDAIELEDSEARRAFVHFSCKDQPELEAEVRALLASYDQSSEFLQASEVDTKESGELTSETVGPKTAWPPFQEVNAEPGTIDPGTILDRYRIEQVLGSGGMGIVYLAMDTRLNRRIAIKIPRREFHSDSDRRLEREARTMASVKHPNLASLLDVAEWNGIKYLLMEFVEGQSLDARIRDERTMDQRMIAQWLCKLCSATACAHEAGVVHRDIKPSNVILRPDGEPVLMDFGLAVSDSEDSRLTKSGAIIGTPAYMAPEQLHGAQHLIGPQSDIYALGAIGYELLTGRAIYEGPTSNVLSDIADGKPPMAPSQLRKDADRNLEAIILQAIARDPKDRFASAKLMGKAFQAYLDNDIKNLRELVHVAPARSKPWNKARWIVAAICCVLVLGSIFVMQTKDREVVTDGSKPVTTDTKSNSLTKSKPLAKPPFTEHVPAYDETMPELYSTLPDDLKLHPLLSPEYKWSEPENLGRAIYSQGPMHECCLTRDEMHLVFRHDMSVRIASRTSLDQPFGAAQVLSTDQYHIFPSISNDLLRLSYCAAIGEGKGGFDLWVRTRANLDEPWSHWELEYPEMDSQDNDGQSWLSSGGLEVYFCSSRPGSLGHDDLWLARRESTEKTFGSPTRLHENMNSAGQDFCPSLCADDRILLFCSTRNGGAGHMDIYLSIRKDRDEDFTYPVRLGKEINGEFSEGRAIWSAANKTLYFESNRPGGHRSSDLWSIRRIPRE